MSELEQKKMARLREVQVHTSVTSLPGLLSERATIPVDDNLELSKYIADCHTLLYRMLEAEKIPNPSERSRLLHVSRGKLMLLRAAWENYLFDYKESLMREVVVGKRAVNLYTLFWRNCCVLNALIIRRKYKDCFPYRCAHQIDYVRRNLLCVSKKSIGEYSMSELLQATRVLSARRWQLSWSTSYVDYLLELEFVVSERVTWLAEDVSLYDEGCKRAQDRPHYGVSMECSSELATWFYGQKKRTRDRQLLEKWMQPEVPCDEAAVQRLKGLLRQRAAGVHDVTRFLRPLKRLLLDQCVREGEPALYTKLHGNKSASAKDILREFRPTNYIAYREDDLFAVKNITELLDSPLAALQPYQELLQLYLINLLFHTTDGCHFDWMRYYVCLESDFASVYPTIKSSDQPLLLQSFTQWHVYFEARVWPAPSLLHAFVGWAQLLQQERQSRLHHSVDIRPILDQLFTEEESPAQEDAGLMIMKSMEVEDVSEWL